MPEPLDDRELAPGDVLMVERKMRDKRTNKAFLWRFFLVVTEPDDFGDSVKGMVVGTTSEKLKVEPLRLSLDDDKNTFQFLPQAEWPDGVHVFRMGMIMKRQIEAI